MIKKIKSLYEAIKFEHTIFALPFAYLGMVLATHGIPTLWQIAWITRAMAGVRSLAPSDLSKLNVAFSNMDGYIAAIVFLCTCLAIYVPWP